MDITLLAAHEQARLIATGELAAVELLDAVQARYHETHDALNAVVVERLDQAHQAALVADRAVASGEELGVFHGVPITVKEVIDWVDTPSTWGEPAHRNHLPVRNAVVLDRLLAQGAVVWGKTNVPLRLGEWQTFNDVYGRTNNPHGLDRTPGGSSGGSAAALAVGLAGLEVGSDIGGSIRFPAHYCGVFGHKPSFGAVSPKGHDYPGHGADVDINVVGPMARSALDLDIAMRVLSDRVLPEEPRSSLDDFRVGLMLDNPLGGEQDDEMTALLAAAVEELVSHDLQVSDVPTGIDHARAQKNYLLMNYAAMSPMTDPGGGFAHGVWVQLANEREEIRDWWAQYFGTVDLLLCPVTAGVAPHHETEVAFADQRIEVNGALTTNQDQWIWAGMASGAYLPATVVPIGRTAAGLPLGLQVIAPYGHDLRSIRFASLVEDVLGGFEPPQLLAR